MSLKKGDFVEVEYTGRLDTGVVFDTTNEAEAQKADIHRNRMMYGPVAICIGHSQIIKGLDEALAGKELGTHTIPVPAEKAFGKKDAKLVHMVPISKFRQQNVQPIPGLQLNIDGAIATIKNVSGGRVLVDFNHPLSGHDVTYVVKINKKIETPVEKVKALVELHFNRRDIGVAVTGDRAELSFPTKIPLEIAKKLEESLSKEVTKLVAEIKNIAVVSREKRRKNKR
ncbi:MAG: peptidylprolyl isomerase [Candidatus Woesearchaeota archaeon]|nr:peptidylprolyl isomerase [Candidatus Woesearchaeota archaeon]